MRKKPTRKRPYFKMESAMTAMLRDASGKMHHGILFDPPLTSNRAVENLPQKKLYIKSEQRTMHSLTHRSPRVFI